MRKSMNLMVALATVYFLVSGVTAWAAEPQTTITVGDLECLGCAKKCTTQLNAVAGVAKVEANVETKTIKVTPKSRAVLSPRAMWEAVEKAGKTPTKIQGPSGTFAAKPQS